MTLLHRRQFQDNNQIWLFMQNEGLYLWTCFLLCFAMVGICKSTPSPTRLFSHRGVWQLWGISSLVSLFPLTTDICQLCHISHRSISLSQFKHPKCPPPIQVSNAHGLFGFFVICSILQPHKAAKGLRLIYFCALVVTMEDRPHFHLK